MVTTQMNLKYEAKLKRPKIQKGNIYVIPYIVSKIVKFTGTQSRMAVTRGWEMGVKGVLLCNENRGSGLQDEKVQSCFTTV